MASLAQHLTTLMEAAFAACDLPLEHARVVVSGQPEHAQFQCNGAMPCAKVAKKNPRAIAEDIVKALHDHPEAAIFQDISIGGPGFINLTLTDAALAKYLSRLQDMPSFGVAASGVGRTVVLDYGSPNVAKPMHVGHLRGAIIGDCLRRLYDFAGYKTIGDNHMGDWGTPMGMILSELELRGHEDDVTMEELAEIYPKAAADCKADTARMALARTATQKLQDGDETYMARWRQFVDVSIEGMKENFDLLGVHFDVWNGESHAHPFIAPMVEDLKSKNVVEESDGALIIRVAEDSDKKELPPLILLKSDGAAMYSTTDLATIVDRIETYGPDRIVYAVDQRQSLHFEQVFRAARKGDLLPESTSLVFAGYGTMNGKDGKPFKTRAGGVMRLEDLLHMGIEKADARLDEAALAKDMDTDERADVAQKVAIAAIKFADLQNNRVSDYVFDLDRMTSFEGKTGPYLLYQAVRIQSLLRKAEEEDHLDGVAYDIRKGDRDLALLLSAFPDHFEIALANDTPHVLCDYAYKLAQAFSAFYGNCHILSENEESLRLSRLKLSARVLDALKTILDMLGIQVPVRM